MEGFASDYALGHNDTLRGASPALLRDGLNRSNDEFL
jgi:hypothetical protein